MKVNLRCRRPSPTKSAAGVVSDTYTTIWTLWLDMVPNLQQSRLRERAEGVDVRGGFTVFCHDTTLDVKERDLLYEVADGELLNRPPYKVVAVELYVGVIVIYLERTEE